MNLKIVSKCVLLAFTAICGGCANLGSYNASEVHHSVNYPLLFTDSIHAVGISKETGPDGKVVRKVGTLTHETTIGGFTRTAVYKDATVESKK
jgi:hypothetical protein